MSGVAAEIIASYETLGMTVEQIAAEMDLELASVKAILFQSSSQFRKDAKKDESLDFTTDEAEESKRIIMNLARYSEEEGIKLKAAQYVYDCKTGRREAGKGLQTVQFNIISFNEQMKKAIEAQKRTEQKAIDVEVEAKQITA